MAPSPPERNASSSSDDEEDGHALDDQDGNPARQEDDPSPSPSLSAKENEKRVHVNFCIGADEPELHKVCDISTGIEPIRGKCSSLNKLHVYVSTL
jgi:hypothetical protein